MANERPTLRQLEYLVALAEHLHFRRAAEACHVTQPALSSQIQALEELLGVQLVERGARRVLLTEAGREVVGQARRILDATDGLLETARAASEPLCGPLRLGVIPTIAPYLLPRALPGLRARYPRLELFLREEFTHVLVQRLEAGELDVLLLALPVSGEVETMPLFDDAFHLAVPPSHRLARRKRVRERDLAGEDVLLLEDGHCFRDQALALCGKVGAHEATRMRATSLGTLAQMVAGGLGTTLLPGLALEVEGRAEGLRVIPFADPPPHRSIGLAWRRASGRAGEYRELGNTLTALATATATATDSPDPT